eukprot:14491221-Heterocapsa_arctica.AAC.1
MEKQGGRGIVVWCPDNREDLGRLCSGIAMAASEGVRGTVTLIITMEPRPGCHNVKQLLDT